MATQVMSEDLAGQENVRFFLYEPGVVDTPMQDEVRSSDPADFPSLQRFIDLKAKGELVAAANSAAFMINRVSTHNEDSLHEFRYATS